MDLFQLGMTNYTATIELQYRALTKHMGRNAAGVAADWVLKAAGCLDAPWVGL